MSAPDTSLAPEEIAEGTLIGDHFRVIRRLGVGGMGEVYLAENLNLPGKRYAIKVLRRELSAMPRYAELLAGEAQKQSLLDHDNIVQLYDFFPWRQRYCLILAYVDGSTLADLIDSQPGGLPEKRALDMMLDILKGLNYAHEHGVLHCDVKPANVLVDRDQRVRVTDFGIARDMGLASSGQYMGVVGTPEYMSPEQVQKPDQVDHRADVYSAGVLLFEMLTGRLPFEHDRSSGEIHFPQLDSEPADLRAYRKGLSPKLASIVATALQRDPAARFQGCLQFQQAINDYRRWQWLRPLIIAASVIAVVGAGAGYWWQQQVEGRAAAERAKAERVAAQQRVENEARAREAIQASIVTAVKSLGSLCRETKRLQLKEEALEIAKNAGDTGRKAVEGLVVQIGDMKKNQADYARGYADSIRQLANFEPRWVSETVAAQPRNDPEADRFVASLGADYAAAAGQRGLRTMAELQAAACRR